MTHFLPRLAALTFCLLFSACSALDPGPPLAQLVLEPDVPPASQGAPLPVQLSVGQVESLTALNTARIAVITDRQIRYLPEVQWSAPAPRLMQALILRSLGEGRRLAGLGGETTMALSDYQLTCLLDSFEIHTADPTGNTGTPFARVGMGLQLTGRNGRVLGYTRVSADSPATSMQTGPLLDAFENALADALAQGRDWVIGAIEQAEAVK